MESRVGSGGLAALLGVLVIGLFAGTRVTGRPASTDPRAPKLPPLVRSPTRGEAPNPSHEAYAAKALERPLGEVRDFFGCERREAGESEQIGAHGVATADPCYSADATPRSIPSLAARHGYAVRYVIALVPDPVDSYVGGEFDTYVTALLRGANASGWLLDRHWFPWAASAPPEAPEGGGKPGAKESPNELGSPHHVSPGIVLFRKDSSRDLLVVFLVGESPLTGIQKRPFVDSLRFISEVERSEKSAAPANPAAREASPQEEERKTIQVLGPFSSGAAVSCSIALESWCRDLDAPQRVHFLSGSATAPDLVRQLQPRSQACPSLTVDFQSTVLSDRMLRKAAFDFFEKRLGWHRQEIALLGESDTSYGRSAASDPDSGSQAEWKLYLPVPSALTSVRTAWERNRQPQDVKIGDVKLPAYALELQLEETRTVRDVFPDFRPMTAPLNELKLEELLSTLSREKIRHLGLLFTDVRDKLFLAEQIKKHAPHVSLFTFESSVLYFHPRINPYMDGMLVVSSYPLSTIPQQLMGGFADDPRRQVFGSDAEQGFYNAAVLCLTDSDVRRPPISTPGGALRHVTKNRWVSGYLTIRGTPYRAPGVWITAVGDGRLVPLDVIRPFDRSDLPLDLRSIKKGSGQMTADSSAIAVQTENTGLPAELNNLIRQLRVSSAFRFLFWIATLGFAFVCASFALGHSERWEKRFKTWPSVFFRPLERPTPSDERQKHGWTLALIVAFSAIWLALATVYAIPFLMRERFQLDAGIDADPAHGNFLAFAEENTLRLLVRILPLLGLLLAILLAYLAWSLGRRVRLRWRWLFPAVAGLTTVALLVVSRWILTAFGPEEADRLEYPVFTYLRAASGPGNLSPLAGLLLLIAGFGLLMVFQLQRLRIRDGWRCSIAAGERVDSADPSLRSIGKLQNQLDRRMLQPFPRSPWFLVLMVVLLAPFLLTFIFVFEAAGDSPAWAKPFAFVFAFLLLPASLAAFSRFTSVWRGLRRIMNRLESSDLVPAFDRCKDELEWHALRSWGTSRRHSYSILIRSVEILRGLSHRSDLPAGVSGEEGSADLFGRLAAAGQHALRGALDANAEGNVVRERGFRVQLLVTLDSAMITVQHMLRSLDEADSELADPALRMELKEYLALHAIAYIRYVFAEIRNSLLASTLGMLFLLAGLASFHFQPIRSVYVLLWSVIGVVAIWTIVIFTQMDRNTLVSRIGGTTPGEVNPLKSGFLLRVATFVLPPVLALVLTQFPRVGETLVGWTTPLVRLFQ